MAQVLSEEQIIEKILSFHGKAKKTVSDEEAHRLGEEAFIELKKSLGMKERI
jgi:hypothetical protein